MVRVTMARLPKNVPRMVCGRRNFQNASAEDVDAGEAGEQLQPFFLKPRETSHEE